MRIPLFDPSALAELRASWRTRDEQAGRRLILETHRQRLRLLDLVI
jgi:hypothetical protein